MKPKPGLKLQYFETRRQGGGVAGDGAVCQERGVHEGCRGDWSAEGMLSWSGAAELQMQAGSGFQ